MMQKLLEINLEPKYFTFAIEKAEKITHIDFVKIASILEEDGLWKKYSRSIPQKLVHHD